jgi:ribonucleotide monophosphatase NagD (HAD superfamily)
MCFSKNEKVLAIGDNLRTDIRGANNLNKDCLFISEGVHRSEINDNNEIKEILIKYKVKINYYQKELEW